jgi:murein DD-endopeptidase MepM/ murein hydrolase activator NlpD
MPGPGPKIEARCVQWDVMDRIFSTRNKKKFSPTDSAPPEKCSGVMAATGTRHEGIQVVASGSGQPASAAASHGVWCAGHRRPQRPAPVAGVVAWVRRGLFCFLNLYADAGDELTHTC